MPLPESLGELLPTDERLASLPIIGDVNIFRYGTPTSLAKDESQDASENTVLEDEFYAEVEIVIANVSLHLPHLCSPSLLPIEPDFRRKGLALEALQLMLGYATGKPEAFSAGSALPHSHSFSESPLRLSPGSLVTKVSDTNIASIRLFEKLGFEITKRIGVFHEVEMHYKQSVEAFTLFTLLKSCDHVM